MSTGGGGNAVVSVCSQGDEDDIYNSQQAYQWQILRDKGYSEEEIARAQKFRQDRDGVKLYTQMISLRAWEQDVSCNFTTCYLKLSLALEGVNRRQDAIMCLWKAHFQRPGAARIILALAKLLFRDDQKDQSLLLCQRLFEEYERQRTGSRKPIKPVVPLVKYAVISPEDIDMLYEEEEGEALEDQEEMGVDEIISIEDITEAYYLGGWVKIHDDDHTQAYRIWQQGKFATKQTPTNKLSTFLSVGASSSSSSYQNTGSMNPNDNNNHHHNREDEGDILSIQCHKRDCWDQALPSYLQQQCWHPCSRSININTGISACAHPTNSSSSSSIHSGSPRHDQSLEELLVVDHESNRRVEAEQCREDDDDDDNAVIVDMHCCNGRAKDNNAEEEWKAWYEDVRSYIGPVDNVANNASNTTTTTTTTTSSSYRNKEDEGETWYKHFCRDDIEGFPCYQAIRSRDGGGGGCDSDRELEEPRGTCMNVSLPAAAALFDIKSQHLNSTTSTSNSCNDSTSSRDTVGSAAGVGLVFRTNRPLMTSSECAAVLQAVDAHHRTHCAGVWSTVRQSSVKTTDVAVEDIPGLRRWLLVLLHARIYPFIQCAFPLLADGTTTVDADTGESRMRVHDAFIVRYNAEAHDPSERSLYLPEHCDTSAVSVILSLSSESAGDYTGGGTWFEALGERGKVVNAEIGHAVAFAGPLKHAGFPIHSGTRHILVLFLYIQDFHYGPLLLRAQQQKQLQEQAQEQQRQSLHEEKQESESEKKQNQQEEDVVLVGVEEGKDELGISSSPMASPCSSISTSTTKDPNNYPTAKQGKNGKEPEPATAGLLSSGGAVGGYVVYRQTVDLVNMLENTDISE